MTNPSGPNPDSGNAILPGAVGLVGGLLGAGASIYDTYQSNKTARENTKRTIAANKREAELAYQRSVEMWHMQNAYNSPEAQMQRFTNAGLNPHLIYGQGSAGNATSAPQYHPPDMQYKFAAPTYGSSIQSILPTLMAVGTWLQNMRLGEARYEQMESTTDRTNQLVEYLRQANPLMVKKAENQLSLFPYQVQAQQYGTDMARQKLFEFEQDFRQKYGESLFNDMGSAFEPKGGSFSDIGGTKRLQFLQESAKLEAQKYRNKLLEAQSSWSDFDITNPQGIMQLVLSGVMGMAGQSLRLPGINRNRPKVTHELESITKGGRRQIRRRTYSQ